MEATANKPRLARGLNSLLGEANTTQAELVGVGKLPVEKIETNPYQPRKRIDDDELTALSLSIMNHGVLQPLVVRPVKDGYQLIAGERRLRAAKAAGLTEVPVHIVAFDDQQVFEAALVENIQRVDLNPIEKAMGFKEYLDKYTISHDQLSSKLGIDRTSLSNLLGLLHLAEAVQDNVRNGEISLGHAKALRTVHDPEKQVAFAKEAILKNLSVHSLEALIKQQRVGAATAAPEPASEPAPKIVYEKTAHVKGLEDDLRQRLAVRVEIRVKAKDKGQIVIGFDSNDDFERILQALQNR